MITRLSKEFYFYNIFVGENLVFAYMGNIQRHFEFVQGKDEHKIRSYVVMNEITEGPINLLWSLK